MPVINMVPDGARISYIESTSQKFYRSKQPSGDMPLKRKYRVGGSAPKQNKHSDNQGHGAHKKKLNAKQKAALPWQPVMVKATDIATGKSRMMTATAFEQLSWGWKIE